MALETAAHRVDALDEILVTGARRAEHLSDLEEVQGIPASVSIVSGPAPPFRLECKSGETATNYEIGVKSSYLEHRASRRRRHFKAVAWKKKAGVPAHLKPHGRSGGSVDAKGRDRSPHRVLSRPLAHRQCPAGHRRSISSR
jgi:hypothetical protein